MRIRAVHCTTQYNAKKPPLSNSSFKCRRNAHMDVLKINKINEKCAFVDSWALHHRIHITGEHNERTIQTKERLCPKSI